MNKQYLEMLGEQYKLKIMVGEQQPIDTTVAESYLASIRELLNFMVDLKQKCPRIVAYRFRGQLLSLTIDGGKVLGLGIWPEAQVEVIDE